MGSRLISRFLIALCLLTSTGWARSPFSDQYVLEHLDIQLRGLHSTPYQEQQVIQKLKSRQGRIFSQEDFDEDLKILGRDFDRVEPRMEFGDGTVRATIRLWPKPSIRNISWEGNSTLSNSKLQSELGFNSGDFFDRPKFNEGFSKVKAMYVSKGFFEAILSYEVLLDENTYEVDVVVHVEEGRCGTVRELTWDGFTSEEISYLSGKI